MRKPHRFYGRAFYLLKQQSMTDYMRESKVGNRKAKTLLAFQHVLQVLLRVAGEFQIEVFLEHVDHAGSEELRRFRTDIDILDSQAEKPKEDGDGFLFEPGKNDAHGKFIDGAIEGFG